MTVYGCIFMLSDSEAGIFITSACPLLSPVGSDVKVLGLMLCCHLLCSLDRRALPDPGVRAWHCPFHLKLLPLHNLEDTQRLQGPTREIFSFKFHLMSADHVVRGYEGYEEIIWLLVQDQNFSDVHIAQLYLIYQNDIYICAPSIVNFLKSQLLYLFILPQSPFQLDI